MGHAGSARVCENTMRITLALKGCKLQPLTFFFLSDGILRITICNTPKFSLYRTIWFQWFLSAKSRISLLRTGWSSEALRLAALTAVTSRVQFQCPAADAAHFMIARRRLPAAAVQQLQQLALLSWLRAIALMTRNIPIIRPHEVCNDEIDSDDESRPQKTVLSVESRPTSSRNSVCCQAIFAWNLSAIPG